MNPDKLAVLILVRKSRIEELRGHKVVLSMSHKLLPSSDSTVSTLLENLLDTNNPAQSQVKYIYVKMINLTYLQVWALLAQWSFQS